MKREGTTMARCYAAVKMPGEKDYNLVPAKSHVFHADERAAFRALERISRRLKQNARGYIWSTLAPTALQDERWEIIQTIAI